MSKKVIGKGTRVLMRDDLVIGNNYSGFEFLSGMDQFRGRSVTISRYDDSDDTFTIEGDDEYYWYPISMVETVLEDTKEKICESCIKNESIYSQEFTEELIKCISAMILDDDIEVEEREVYLKTLLINLGRKEIVE